MPPKVEEHVKKWWPKALELTVFVLLMLFTMKSELGVNKDLIDRNHENIIRVEEGLKDIDKTLRQISERILVLEIQHRGEISEPVDRMSHNEILHTR